TSDHQRVDLAQRAIFLLEEQREFAEDVAELFDRLLAVGAAFADLQCVGDLARLVRAEASDRIYVLRNDLLRRMRGDLFDLDTTFGGCHDRDLTLGAVDDQPQVELAFDVQTLLDVQASHGLALGAGLVRDELFTENALGDLGGSRRTIFDDLDATGFTATTRVDLRLDHDHGDLGLGD